MKRVGDDGVPGDLESASSKGRTGLSKLAAWGGGADRATGVPEPPGALFSAC